MKYIHSLINGELIKTNESVTRENPASLEKIYEVSMCSEKEVDLACNCAQEAFKAWSKLPGSQRGEILFNISRKIKEESETLSRINTNETGKPLKESMLVELNGVIKTFEYYAGLASKINGTSQSINENLLSLTIKEPIGVVGQILPWNFPLLLAAWKIAPALASGCTIVLKPSELTPAGTLELAKICEDAGVPPGVINIVQGTGEAVGSSIVKHKIISKISFTGSTEVGKQIVKNSSENLTKLSLELGGKAPNIVFADSNIESCLEANLRGGFFNQGENCTAVTRLLVDEKIIDEFIESYVSKVSKIIQGMPNDITTEIGCLISKTHIDRVDSYVKQGIKEGGELLLGGEANSEFPGYFYKPTIIKIANTDNILFKDEVFGPVVSVMSFGSEEEAISLANQTSYGLAGGVWTQDISRAINVSKLIDAGYLWINTYGGIIPETPYGGFKQSGYGKELGTEGLNEYLKIKNISIFTGNKLPKWYGNN